MAGGFISHLDRHEIVFLKFRPFFLKFCPSIRYILILFFHQTTHSSLSVQLFCQTRVIFLYFGPMRSISVLCCSSYCKLSSSYCKLDSSYCKRNGGAVFTVGGAQFTVGGSAFTVGGACLHQEEHLNRAAGPGQGRIQSLPQGVLKFLPRLAMTIQPPLDPDKKTFFPSFLIYIFLLYMMR